MIAVLGAFDGFHLGHRRLLDAARVLAGDTDGRWAVITFFPHPATVLRAHEHQTLFVEEERDFLTRLLHIPSMIRIPFTRDMATMRPDAFLDMVGATFPVDGIVTGMDFRFGRGREGDASFLGDYCRRRRWRFKTLDSLTLNGAKVGSSAIRNHVLLGEMPQARKLLGYPFFIEGQVIRGDGRGRGLGFPTANIRYASAKVLPRRGVYGVSVFLDGRWWPGALNIGSNPTFLKDGVLRAEAYVVGYGGNLYGKKMRLFLEQFVRDEEQFPASDELKTRMARDVQEAVALFDRAMKDTPSLYEMLGRVIESAESGPPPVWDELESRD